MSDSRQHAPLYDVANLKELCQDAESCGRLSKFEEEFLDSMREKVLTFGDRVFLTPGQQGVLVSIERKVYA
jgi:hypothetical protein